MATLASRLMGSPQPWAMRGTDRQPKVTRVAWRSLEPARTGVSPPAAGFAPAKPAQGNGRRPPHSASHGVPERCPAPAARWLFVACGPG